MMMLEDGRTVSLRTEFLSVWLRPPPISPGLRARCETASGDYLSLSASSLMRVLRAQVESVEGKLASGELHGREELGKAKTALGQLNGVLEKLQLDGVDSITVGDLGSGACLRITCPYSVHTLVCDYIT